MNATALYVACEAGQSEVVALLLKQPNLEVNKPNAYGFTPYQIASQCRYTEIVALLRRDGRVVTNQASRG